MFEKLQFWKKHEDPLATNPFDTQSAAAEHPFGADTQNPFTSQSQAPAGFDQPSTTSDPFAQQSDYSQPQQQSYDPSQSGGYNGPSTLGGAEFSNAQVVSHNATGTQSQNSSGYGDELHKKDVELILSRLDLIKSELDNVQHKLEMMEQHNSKPKW